MLDDLQRGVWSELCAPARRRSIRIGALLQNNYLTQMNAKLNPSRGAGGADCSSSRRSGIRIEPLAEDARSELRGELVSLRDRDPARRREGGDRETKLHLQARDHRIGEILDPKTIGHRSQVTGLGLSGLRTRDLRPQTSAQVWAVARRFELRRDRDARRSATFGLLAGDHRLHDLKEHDRHRRSVFEYATLSASTRMSAMRGS